VELSLIDPKVSFDADWLINATPVRDGSLFEADPTLARRGVLEVVYGGAPTVLLERARERGIQRIDGMQMLVRQAELQFELHSARKAPAGLFAGAGQRYLASLG
jgi:shikimate 5-dehydrogenase